MESEAKEPIPINEQLSEILNYMKTFLDNIAQLNDKIDYISEKLFSLEKETQKKFDEVESKLCSKASTASCQRLANRTNEIVAKLNSLTASLSTDALMKESYSKRLNILIYSQNLSDLQNLSDSNENDESIAKQCVYVSDHLPKAFLIRERSFMPEIKAARQAKQKTYRKIENGRYNLYVNNVEVEPSNSDTTAWSENESWL